MKSLLAAAAIALAFAGYAQAQAVTATLTTPMAKSRHVVLEGTIWECKDNTCSAVTADGETATWRACKLLTRITGPISAYTGLDAAQLARCNAEKTAK